MEKIKSMVLAYLVAQSLVFTYVLWYGSPSYQEVILTVQEPYVFQETLLIEEAVTPSITLVPVEEGGYRAMQGESEQHGEAWEVIYHLLREAQIEGRVPSMDHAPTGKGEEPAMIMYFSPPFPLQALENYAPWGTAEKMKKLIIYYHEDDFAFLVEEEEREPVHLSYSSSRASDRFSRLVEKIQEEALLYRRIDEAEMSELLEADLGLAGEYIYVPDGNIQLSPFVLQKEDISEQHLLKAVFLDPNLVRKIEERDHSTIYTDGKKGLRLFQGFFEYSDPRMEGGEVTYSYYHALQKATEYLCNYGGWPSGLRLEEVELLEQEPFYRTQKMYHARWSLYHHGYPLLGERGWAWMTFNDGGMISYHRYTGSPGNISGERRAIATAEEALKEVVEILLNDQNDDGHDDIDKNVEALYLGFYIHKSEGVYYGHPSWVIELDNGEKLVLDAGDLSVLYRGEEWNELFQS